jgi:hypothetical protein
MKLLKSIGLIAGQMTKLKSSVEASPTNIASGRPAQDVVPFKIVAI